MECIEIYCGAKSFIFDRTVEFLEEASNILRLPTPSHIELAESDEEIGITGLREVQHYWHNLKGVEQFLTVHSDARLNNPWYIQMHWQPESQTATLRWNLYLLEQRTNWMELKLIVQHFFESAHVHVVTVADHKIKLRSNTEDPGLFNIFFPGEKFDPRAFGRTVEIDGIEIGIQWLNFFDAGLLKCLGVGPIPDDLPSFVKVFPIHNGIGIQIGDSPLGIPLPKLNELQAALVKSFNLPLFPLNE